MNFPKNKSKETLLFNRQRFFIFIRILVSAGLIGYLVIMLDWARLGFLLSWMEKKFLLFAPLLILTMVFFSALRWRCLLHNLNVYPHFKLLYDGYLVGAFSSIFLPGVIGGDLVRIGLCYKRLNSSIRVVTTTVLIERFCGVLVLFILGSLAFFNLPSELLSALGRPKVNILAFGMLLSVVLVLVLYGIGQRFLDGGALEKRTNRWVKKLGEMLHLVFRLPYRVFFIVILLSGLSQAMDIISCFILAKALKIPIPLILFFGFMPVVYLITILPISIGGLGVREGILVYLLTQVGVQSSDAVALSFLIY
ncbi:MAG: flippase-like domain-containing protein, partial [Deltaproteobacteria bacterium]|nr:flippase-like domain-containing protein [Deltaproteobacteria bacterium]